MYVVTYETSSLYKILIFATCVVSSCLLPQFVFYSVLLLWTCSCNLLSKVLSSFHPKIEKFAKAKDMIEMQKKPKWI